MTVNGTVTANLSATDNAVLDTIDGVLDTISGNITTCNTSDVAVSSLVPGTGATNLGKAEGANHTSGDTGVTVFGVHQSVQADFAADGDYVPFSVNDRGEARVAIGGVVDSGNSTVVELGSSATFAGTYLDVTNYSEFTVILFKDTVSSGTLHMDLSSDGTNTDRTKSIVYPITSNGGVHTLAVVSQYMRIRYVNDSVAQTTIRIQSMLHVAQSKELTSTTDQPLSNRNDVQLVRDPTMIDLDYAREFFEGKTAEYIWGHNAVVGTTYEDIWPNGGNYPFQSAAQALEVVSSNANDSGISTGVLTIENSTNPADGDTITIGSRTYTFHSTLSLADGSIHIGSSVSETILNIVDAFDLGAGGDVGEGVGVGYSANMTINTSVNAEDGAGDTVDFTSLTTYPLANNGNIEVLATTETGANLSFGAATMQHPTGCHVVELHGLSSTGAYQEEYVVMNGTTPVDAVNTYIRMNVVHCETTGTNGGAHFGDIAVQLDGGGTVIANMKGFETIDTATYGYGHSSYGGFSVPLGKVAYLTIVSVNVDSTKSADIILYEKKHLLRSASPFYARQIIWKASKLSGYQEVHFHSYRRIDELSDIYFRAKSSNGTSDVEVEIHFFMVDVNSSGK